MIKTEFVRIDMAAATLGLQVDFLLIAAIENLVGVYLLFNHTVEAQEGRFVRRKSISGGDPEIVWVTRGDRKIEHFLFIPLQPTDVASILKHGQTVLSWTGLSDADSDNWRWATTDRWPEDFTEDDLKVEKNMLFIKSKDVEALKEGNLKRIPWTNESSISGLQRKIHLSSDNLAILNQAAAKFWANADRDDPQTHPKNAHVVSWLMDHGYKSKTLAEKAATIIRPEWATTGRPQEK